MDSNPLTNCAPPFTVQWKRERCQLAAVNSVAATLDIMDKEPKLLRNSRWAKASLMMHVAE
jgi:hypothetical protein